MLSRLIAGIPGILVLSILCLSMSSSPGNCQDEANQSSGVGADEKLQWLEIGENENDDLISIGDNRLSFNYYASIPINPDLGCSVGGFLGKDVEISVKLYPSSPDYGNYYGVSYRLSTPDSRFRSSMGYFVQLDMKGKPNTVSLWCGSTQIALAEVKIPPGFSSLRVKAFGIYHQVFLNDVKVIEEADETILQPGYVGLFAWYGNVWAEEFRVTDLSTNTTLWDDFDRPASGSLGAPSVLDAETATREKQIRWHEAGDNQNGNLIALRGKKICLRYTESEPTNPQLACNIAGFKAADIDLSIKLSPDSDYYSNFYGVGYRLPDKSSIFQDAGGYYVQLDRHESPHKIALWCGQAKLVEKNIEIPNGYPTLRVVAKGSSHKAYLNDKLVLEVTDDKKLIPGTVGVFAYYSLLYADDFSVTDLATGMKLSDSFDRSGSNTVGNVEATTTSKPAIKPTPPSSPAKKSPVQNKKPTVRRKSLNT